MIDGLVSVLLPTTGRCARAVNAVTSLLDTAGHHDLEVICPVDVDRETTYALCRLLADRLPLDRWRVPFSPEYQGNSAAWNKALALSRGEFLVFAADDLVFADGWLDEALKVMRTLGPAGGLVGFNDGHWDGNELSTHYLMSRRFVIEVLGGCVAWDFYKHSFNDLEINERAKAAGRFAWAPAAHVRHEHWTYGQRPQDATDQRWLPDWQAARDTYERRKQAGFPTDYPPAITA